MVAHTTTVAAKDPPARAVATHPDNGSPIRLPPNRRIVAPASGSATIT
jgi:hypothetical protein